jgi:hypothetical protein
MTARFDCSLSLAAAAACCVAAVTLAAPSPSRAEDAGLKFSKQCLFISPNEGCAVADVNKDGTLDVIAGTCWFAGPDYIGRPLRDIEEFQDDYYHSNGDHAYDVNGDGWVDVIAGDWLTPEIYWFENPGEPALTKGLKWKKHLLKKTRAQNEAFELKDFNDDGVPELFVNCWVKGEPLVVWRFAKDDEGKPTIEPITLGDEGSGHGYAFGDVNGDGREDILCETGWYERPEGDPFAQPWKKHPETALPHPSCPFVVTDLTGDGRADLIWGKAHDYGLYWWEQKAPKADGTTVWEEHLIDDSWSQVHAIVWADLDGDGQNELITGKRVRGHAGRDPGGKAPACLWYYEWDAKERKFTRFPISPPGGGVGIGMQIRVVDLNKDGRLDIAVGGKSGTWVLLNEG